MKRYQATVVEYLSEWRNWLDSCGGDRSTAEYSWHDHLVDIGLIEEYRCPVHGTSCVQEKPFRMLRPIELEC